MLFLISKITSNPLIGGQEKLMLSVHVDLTKQKKKQINRHNSIVKQQKLKNLLQIKLLTLQCLWLLLLDPQCFPFFDTFLGSFLLVICFQ